MYAEVIIDVNNHNVNQSYYYLIPKEFQDKDLEGYRVEVPFGSRVIQGYIVAVKKGKLETCEVKDFKYIKKIKDDFPILTKEMILLSKVMTDELFCTRIQAIETLIPTSLKNKYVEYYELIDANTTLLLDYAKYFNSENLIEKKKFEKLFTVSQIGYLISLKAIRLISKIKEVNNVEVEEYIKNGKSVDIPQEELHFKDRLHFAWEQDVSTAKKVAPYVLIGVGIGAIIHNWIPEEIIVKILGANNPFGVIIATIAGVPMYADIFGTIPIAEALLAKGALLGVVLSFMMGVTTLSLPSMIMLRKAVKPKLLWIFIAICTVGIILVGYFFNAVQPMLI